MIKKEDQYYTKFFRRGEMKIDNTKIMKFWKRYHLKQWTNWSIFLMIFYLVIIDYCIFSTIGIIIPIWIKLIIIFYGMFWVIFLIIMLIILGRMYYKLNLRNNKYIKKNLKI